MKTNSLKHLPEKTDIKELEDIMICAKWIVFQFQDLNFLSLAAVFQRAIEDSEAWIKTMNINGEIKKENADKTLCEEAETIRKLLIKFSSIKDPNVRKSLLRDMDSLAQQKTH